jgi:hypothetical protein
MNNKRIYNMDMKEGQDPEVFIMKLEYNQYWMEELGSKITDKQLKIHILNNLPMEYDVSVNLLTRKITTISWIYDMNMTDSKVERMVVVMTIILIVIQMKNTFYLWVESLKENAIIVDNMGIESELVGSKIPARNQMEVAVKEVVNSKILLPDEGAIIKEVVEDKEEAVEDDSAEPATIVRKWANKSKTVTRRKETKVVRQQQLQQVTIIIIIVVIGIIIPAIIITSSNTEMAEMMCITMDLGFFDDDELPSDEFEDLLEPEYKLLTQDEASDHKEEETEEESSDIGGEFDRDDQETYVQGVFMKEELDEYREYLKIPKAIRKEENEKTYNK